MRFTELPTASTLSSRVWHTRARAIVADDAWNHEHVLLEPVTGKRLRTTIRRAGDDDASYGRVDLWTPAGWVRVLERPVTDLPGDVYAIKTTDTRVGPPIFSDAVYYLLHEAMMITHE